MSTFVDPIQLIDSARRAAAFIRSVQDAPREVKASLESLRVLQLVLEQVDRLPPEETQTSALAAALKQCSSLSTDMQEVFMDLSSGMKSSRKTTRSWAAIKVAKKEKIILRLCTAIESAKSSLQLALQASITDKYLSTAKETNVHVQTLGDSISTLNISDANMTDPAKGTAESDGHALEASEAIERLSASLSPLIRDSVKSSLETCFSKLLEVSDSSNSVASSVRPIHQHETALVERPTEFLSLLPKPPTSIKQRRVLEYARTHTCHLPFGNVQICLRRITLSTKVGRGDRARRLEQVLIESSFKFSPYPWLRTLRVLWDVHFDLAYSSAAGWSITYCPLTAIDPTAPVFYICYGGTVGDLEDCLSNDSDLINAVSNGWGLIDFALCGLNLDLVDYLCAAGAKTQIDPWMTVFISLSTPTFTIWGQYTLRSTGRFISVFDTLQATGKCFDLQASELSPTSVTDHQSFYFTSFLCLDMMKTEVDQMTNHCIKPSISPVMNALLDAAYTDFWDCPILYDSRWCRKKLVDAFLFSTSEVQISNYSNLCTLEDLKSVAFIWIYNLPRVADYGLTRETSTDAITKRIRLILSRTNSLHFTLPPTFEFKHWYAKEYEYEEGFLRPGLLLWPDEPVQSFVHLAMQRSATFSILKSGLRALEIDFLEFARREAELVDDGWSPMRLCTLFAAEIGKEPWRAGNTCERCNGCLPHHVLKFFALGEQINFTLQSPRSTACEEPQWDVHVARTKAGLGSATPFSEDEKQQIAAWKKRVLTKVEVRICCGCLTAMAEEGVTFSDEARRALDDWQLYLHSDMTWIDFGRFLANLPSGKGKDANTFSSEDQQHDEDDEEDNGNIPGLLDLDCVFDDSSNDDETSENESAHAK